MAVLIAIALKSLFVAGLTLGVLALMKHRSAAERSWVAHIGLLALVVMAFAPLALPKLTLEVPALLGQAPTLEAPTETASAGRVATTPVNLPAMPVTTTASRPLIHTPNSWSR